MDHLPTSLKCPNCASAIRESDYDPEQGTIRCGYCGTLMLPPKAQRSGFRPRPVIPLPEGMTLEMVPDGLLIIRQWRTLSTWITLPFILIWAYMLTRVLSSARFEFAQALFMAIGGGMVYYALAQMMNHTRVDVSRSTVTVSHGPLPWAGWRQIIAGQIDQLYCKETLRRTKNGTTTLYEVWSVLSDGRQTRLLRAGMEPDQALYIEQQIESLLDLKDRELAGEYRR